MRPGSSNRDWSTPQSNTLRCGPKGHGSWRYLSNYNLFFFPQIPSPTGVTRSNPQATLPS